MTIIAFQIGHAAVFEAVPRTPSIPWEPRIGQSSEFDPRDARSAGGRRATDLGDTTVQDK